MVKPVKPRYSKTAITYVQTKYVHNGIYILIYNSQENESQDITHLSFIVQGDDSLDRNLSASCNSL